MPCKYMQQIYKIHSDKSPTVNLWQITIIVVMNAWKCWKDTAVIYNANNLILTSTNMTPRNPSFFFKSSYLKFKHVGQLFKFSVWRQGLLFLGSLLYQLFSRFPVIKAWLNWFKTNTLKRKLKTFILSSGWDAQFFQLQAIVACLVCSYSYTVGNGRPNCGCQWCLQFS